MTLGTAETGVNFPFDPHGLIDTAPIQSITEFVPEAETVEAEREAFAQLIAEIDSVVSPELEEELSTLTMCKGSKAYDGAFPVKK
ncbi:MAG TPA: hypothetical protein VLG16_02520 [Candidatus Saccharimonadales bacterium]|nr:hypothetical protein [Candidatus Saccharimonadales bacterium]